MNAFVTLTVVPCSSRTNSNFVSRSSEKRIQAVKRSQRVLFHTKMSATSTAADIEAKKIDGKKIAAQVTEEIKAEVAKMKEQHNMVPGLAVIIVGERKDSQTYVRSKRKACEDAGIASFGYELPETATQEELIKLIEELNHKPEVHGILVQLPIPKHMDSEVVLDKIAFEKDVDGFHPLNMGRLCMSGRQKPLFVPCTPKGCIELLKRSNVSIEGKNAVVLGRSNIVGLPVAMLLMQANATVTICHSRTKDLPAKVQQADIIVAAIGKPNFVQGSWVKPGAVIIDVGINAVEDKTKKAGYRLVGDVDYEAALPNASLITPVPGGVGPMTIAMLLANTLDAAKRKCQ